MNMIRKALIATTFSAAVAGALTGGALSGETAEFDTAATCATAHWPMIPAECLEGGPDRDFRFVSANMDNQDKDMQVRFEVAFQ